MVRVLDHWWENLAPILEQLLKKGPWAWETVVIEKAILEGDAFRHEDTKDSDFRLWVKATRRQVNWLKLGEAKIWWSRSIALWPLKIVKCKCWSCLRQK